MQTEFVDSGVWRAIRRVAKKSGSPWLAAIAYFGKGADGLLPRRARSQLVVDASDHTVKSGQTHPQTLLRLVEHGVEVFTVSNLHAKVVVIGRSAVVGSANASMRSANSLIEAAVLTSDSATVAKARLFVRGLCLQRLTPERLRKLARIYRPPHVIGGKKAQPARARPTLAPLSIVQLEEMTWPKSARNLAKRGRPKAEKAR